MKLKRLNEDIDFDDFEIEESPKPPPFQRVKVYCQVCGDYCAFHEMSFTIVFDVTNDIQLGEYTKRQCERYRGDYCDISLIDAIKIKNKYYVDL